VKACASLHNRKRSSNSFPQAGGLLLQNQANIRPYAGCYRMDIPGPTTQVGTRTDYSVGPWDYSNWAARHLLAWSARTTED
jgi:hypothetical protein